MEYSIQKLENSAVEIAISVETEEWDICIKEAYEKNKHQFKLEGFRKGKVPFNILVNRFGKESFYEDAMDIALNKYYGEVLQTEGEGFEPVGKPELDVKEVSEDGLKVVISTAIYPTATLGEYKGLTIEAASRTLDEGAVDAEIVKIQRQASREVEITDRAIQIGDKVNLDYSGSVDGVKFDGGTAEAQDLDIGSGMFIPGFEDQMVGMVIGQEGDIKVTFPAEYGAAELAGKDAVFAVKVNSIHATELPAIDDELAKDASEFDTLAELKADLEAKLIADKELRATYAEDDKIIEAVAANTEVSIPQIMVEEEIDRVIDDMKMRMQQSGIQLEDYLKYLGTTIEDMRKERAADAEKSVKTRLVLEAVIKAEGIKVEKEDFDSAIEKIAAEQEKTIEEIQKSLNEYDAGRMMNQIMADKLFAFLRTVNTIA
ncbi:MAG: trigger factor [Bacillota bacterium]